MLLINQSRVGVGYWTRELNKLLRHCVVIREDRILAVCSTEDATKEGLAVEKFSGCIMPGLIDAHVTRTAWGCESIARYCWRSKTTPKHAQAHDLLRLCHDRLLTYRIL